MERGKARVHFVGWLEFFGLGEKVYSTWHRAHLWLRRAMFLHFSFKSPLPLLFLESFLPLHNFPRDP